MAHCSDFGALPWGEYRERTGKGYQGMDESTSVIGERYGFCAYYARLLQMVRSWMFELRRLTVQLMGTS